MTIRVRDDDDVFEIRTSRRSVGDREFYITVNPQGYYIVGVTGSGEKPALCYEHFTNQREAFRALDKYEHDNAKRLAQRALNKKIVEDRKNRE